MSESNLFSLFPQTYIFTDEEDGALKRRIGNDLSYDTTFLLHLQPLNCPGLERGSGVRVGCPAPALPTETCALLCPVVAMIWCSWLTPGHAANWRQSTVCFKASMGRSSTCQSPSTSASWLAMGRLEVLRQASWSWPSCLALSRFHLLVGGGVELMSPCAWVHLGGHEETVNKPLPSCPDVFPVTMQSRLALNFAFSGRWPCDLHQLLC